MTAVEEPSLSRRLARTFLVLVAVLVLVGGAGVGGLVATGRAHDQEERLQLMEASSTAMLLEMANAETGVRGYRLAQQRSFLEPYEEGRAAFPQHVERALALARPDERALVEEQVAIADRWFAVYGDPVAAMAPGEVEVSDELTQRNKEIFDSFRAVGGRLDDLLADRDAAARARASAVRTAALVGSALALAVALGVSLVAARRLRGSLVGPLDDVVTVLGGLAAGDHAARSDDRRGPCEVRAVARSVNHLADESDRLRAERAEAARLAELGAGIGRRIRDQLDAEESLTRAVTLLGRGVAADRAWVRLLDDAGLGPSTARWATPGLEAPVLPALRGQGVASWLQSLHDLGGAVRVDDLEADLREGAAGRGDVGGEDVADHLRAFAAGTGATALLVLPVGAGETALGSLAVAVHSGPRRWTDGEVALTRSVAADLGRALVLARLYRQQEELVEQLRELDRTKTDFLSAVSHELRTPLTSISGYLELLRDGDGGEIPLEADRMLAVVERNTQRLRSLIEDLLTLSRIESGAFRATYRDVLLHEVVGAAVASVQPAADAAGVELVVDAPPAAGEGLVVAGDPVQLDRVLLNLLTNGVKFTPRGGVVRLAVRPRAADVVVEVEDTGMGIPERDQERLFRRFFRATNAVDAAVPGTGLGLLIVRSIVEHHDGDLRLRSREGVGTVVTVRLPRQRARSAPAPARPGPGLARAAGGGAA
ncbi:ATP-binding protein [uncultured Pseudokineococcus sp.]|uniref:ATP-binding protein n=1 Tax=uncultured Pseudokineococcus sp. TaxID=1642928 RepID=UPI0026145274|nr:ATP-binding protein [uncultured Pseudokineococcus sp.]